jgi:hypothetical protein
MLIGTRGRKGAWHHEQGYRFTLGQISHFEAVWPEFATFRLGFDEFSQCGVGNAITYFYSHLILLAGNGYRLAFA